MRSTAIGTWLSPPPALVPGKLGLGSWGCRGEQGMPSQCFGGAAKGRMRAPRTQPPTPMDLPQGPPVPAVPSARGHRLHPARGVLASAPAVLASAPVCPLPRAARDLQASFARSAASPALLSPPKAGAGEPRLTPPLRSHQGKPPSPGFIPTKVKASQKEALTVSPLGPVDPSIPAGPWRKAKAVGGLGEEGCCLPSCSADETPAHRSPARPPGATCHTPGTMSPSAHPSLRPSEQGLQPAHGHGPSHPPTPTGSQVALKTQRVQDFVPICKARRAQIPAAQQVHGGGGHPHPGDVVGSEPGQHPPTCVPRGPGGPRLPCKPCGPCKAVGDKELLLESNPCVHRAKPAVQNLSWETRCG